MQKKSRDKSFSAKLEEGRDVEGSNLSEDCDWRTCASDDEEYQNQFEISGQQDKITKLYNKECIPTTPSIYIDRYLTSDTICLDPEIFLDDAPDIFVFKDMKISDLNKILRPNSTVSSSGLQLEKIKSRFIILEQNDHWKALKTISGYPINLVRVGEGSDNVHKYAVLYILEETSGDSTLIQKYSFRQPPIIGLSISQDEFMLKTIDEATNRCFLICDLPGSGKSMLLANLAKNIQSHYSKAVVAYIPFSDIIRKSDIQNLNELNAHNTLRLVLEHISTSPLAKPVTMTNISGKNRKLVLLVDGFDSIVSQDFKFELEFLKQLLENENILLYISSRPHFRSELEQAFQVISYCILEFTETQQRNFLFKFWQNELIGHNIHSIHKYIASYVALIKNILSRGNNVIGAPLLLNLLAIAALTDIKSNLDLQITDLQNLSLHEHISHTRDAQRIDSHEYTVSETTNITKIFKSFLDLALKTRLNLSDDKKQDSSIPSVVRQALGFLFPDIENQDKTYVNKDSGDIHEIKFSLLGISASDVIKVSKEKICFHHTVAEYMVGCLLAGVLTTASCSEMDIYIVNHVVNSVLITDYECPFELFTLEYPYKHSFTPVEEKDSYGFRHSLLIYFINEKLIELDTLSPNKNIAEQFLALVDSQQIFRVLLCSIKANCLAFVRLISTYIKTASSSVIQDYQNYLTADIRLHPDSLESVPRCFIMLTVAAQYSNLDTIKEIFQLFNDCFQYDLNIICAQAPSSLKSPLHWAIEKLDIETVTFLMEKFPFERQYLYFCVIHSYGDTTENLKKRIELCLLLMRNNKRLILETSFDRYGMKLEGPLVSDKVDLELIKFLIQEGANIRATYWNETIVRRSVSWMNAEEYYELCRHLVIECKAFDLFRSNPKWKSPFHEILRVCDKNKAAKALETFKITGVHPNDKDEGGNTLLLSAAEGGQVVNILKKLFQQGADIRTVNKEGQNALHKSVADHIDRRSFRPESVKYLIYKGVSILEKDSDGNTPFDLAMKTLDKYGEPFKSFQEKFESLQQIINLLK